MQNIQSSPPMANPDGDENKLFFFSILDCLDNGVIETNVAFSQLCGAE